MLLHPSLSAVHLQQSKREVPFQQNKRGVLFLINEMKWEEMLASQLFKCGGMCIGKAIQLLTAIVFVCNKSK